MAGCPGQSWINLLAKLIKNPISSGYCNKVLESLLRAGCWTFSLAPWLLKRLAGFWRHIRFILNSTCSITYLIQDLVPALSLEATSTFPTFYFLGWSCYTWFPAFARILLGAQWMFGWLFAWINKLDLDPDLFIGWYGTGGGSLKGYSGPETSAAKFFLRNSE